MKAHVEAIKKLNHQTKNEKGNKKLIILEKKKESLNDNLLIVKDYIIQTSIKINKVELIKPLPSTTFQIGKIELQKTDPEFQKVEKIILGNNISLNQSNVKNCKSNYIRIFKQTHFSSIKVKKIIKNVNLEMELKYLESIKKITDFTFKDMFKKNCTLIDENTGRVFLLRAVDHESYEKHFQNGLDSIDGHLGEAIYFSDNTSKELSNSKCIDKNCKKGSKCLGHKENNTFVILVSDVALGKVNITHKTNIKSLKQGYDSVFGKQACDNFESQFLFNEFALYDKNRVFPKYAVFIEKFTDDWSLNKTHWAYQDDKTGKWLPFDLELQRYFIENEESKKFQHQHFEYDLENRKMTKIGESKFNNIIKVKRTWKFVNSQEKDQIYDYHSNCTIEFHKKNKTKSFILHPENQPFRKKFKYQIHLEKKKQINLETNVERDIVYDPLEEVKIEFNVPQITEID